MKIQRYIDIEDAIRLALKDHTTMTIYVKPLPANFTVPCIEITAVGGSEDHTIDSFEVVLDSRAEDEATAQLNLRNAVGLLKTIAHSQTTDLRYAKINTLGSWGKDPVRPELAMCSARMSVIAHAEEVEV